MVEDNTYNLFDHLKDLGFDNLSEILLYEDKKDTKSGMKTVKKTSPADYVYERKLTCPVCNTEIQIKAVKSSGVRVISRDTDFMTLYQEPNPSFYDAWLCSACGYTALSSRFNAINSRQISLVKRNITPQWKLNKTYPTVFTVDDAIEMHQMALLNAVAIGTKDSEKAMICLKLSWLCRIKNDPVNEKKFQVHAQQGLIRALEHEYFPVFGLDENTVEYLVGEIYRRLGDNTNALMWFSRVLSSRQAKSRIKDMARDQKDAIFNHQGK